MFSRSTGPLQCLVNVNYKCFNLLHLLLPVVPSLFILASSVCRSLWCLISALTQGGEGGHLFRLTYGNCPVGREEHCKQISLACVGSAHSVWTTLGLSQVTAACAFPVYTAQASACSAGHCPKWALHFVHFPGLNHSGSGSRVVHKGTDSIGHAFCALPRSEQLRQPGAWQLHCSRCTMHLNHLPILTRFPGA